MEAVEDYMKNVREYTDDDDHLQANEALALLLRGDASSAATAKTITEIYEPSLQAGQGIPTHHLWYKNKVYEFFGDSLSIVIREFGSAEVQARLVDLLVEISRQPDLKYADGSPIAESCGEKDEMFWKDLPGWSFCFTEDGLRYDYSRGFFPKCNEKYLAQRPHFLNATRFAATLLQKGKFAVALPVEANCLLKRSLEHSYDKDSNWKAHIDDDEWPILIPAASIWLSIAGKTIYTHCLGSDTAGGWDRGIWTLHKWENWKKQLGALAKRNDFDEECRTLAAQTVRKMVEIEAEDLV